MQDNDCGFTTFMQCNTGDIRYKWQAGDRCRIDRHIAIKRYGNARMQYFNMPVIDTNNAGKRRLKGIAFFYQRQKLAFSSTAALSV
jgi:hypothetical protein